MGKGSKRRQHRISIAKGLFWPKGNEISDENVVKAVSWLHDDAKIHMSELVDWVEEYDNSKRAGER